MAQDFAQSLSLGESYAVPVFAVAIGLAILGGWVRHTPPYLKIGKRHTRNAVNAAIEFGSFVERTHAAASAGGTIFSLGAPYFVVRAASIAVLTGPGGMAL